MLLRSRRARDLAVGDVADEYVAERVLALARNRRAARPSARTPCARARAGAPRPASASTPSTASTAPSQKTLPTTAASWSSRFSSSESASSRAAMMPCTVSGSSTSSPRSSRHSRVLLGVERVAAGPRERAPPACPARAARSRAALGASRVGLLVESGDSEIVSAFGLPPPQPGRRSRARGVRSPARAAGRRRRARRAGRRSRACASSAQWRSSNTSTSGRCSASASRKRRQAAKPLPPGSAAPPRPGRRADAGGARPTAPPRVGDGLTDRARQLLPGLLGGVALEDARLRLDDLAERPEGDAFAVGKRATLPPA